jgi:hypothetical protein
VKGMRTLGSKTEGFHSQIPVNSTALKSHSYDDKDGRHIFERLKLYMVFTHTHPFLSEDK